MIPRPARPVAPVEPPPVDNAPLVTHRRIDLDFHFSADDTASLTLTPEDRMVEHVDGWVITYANGELLTVYKPVRWLSSRERVYTTAAQPFTPESAS